MRRDLALSYFLAILPATSSCGTPEPGGTDAAPAGEQRALEDAAAMLDTRPDATIGARSAPPTR